jgi:hypothetical protein
VTRARLLTAGLIGFALAVIFTAPAELLRGPLQQALPSARLGVMHGHALSGHAVPAVVGGLPMERATWRWRPLGLFAGRLTFDLVFHVGDMKVGLRAAHRPWSDEVTLHDLAGELDLEQLGRILPQLPGRARGRLRLDGVTVTLDPDGWPRQVAGRLQLREAALITPIAMPIGEADGTLGMDGDRFEIGFTMPPSAAMVGHGTLHLAADGRYRLQGRLAPGSKAGQETTALLLLAGRQESDGSVRIDQQGKLQ